LEEICRQESCPNSRETAKKEEKIGNMAFHFIDDDEEEFQVMIFRNRLIIVELPTQKGS
jgi:hypothetical protein